MSRKVCRLTSDPNCQLCDSMEEYLQPQFGPGLWAYVPMNFTTGAKRVMGIVITKTKSKKEQPRLLNFCSFCGERLLDDDAKPFWDNKAEDIDERL